MGAGETGGTVTSTVQEYLEPPTGEQTHDVVEDEQAMELGLEEKDDVAKELPEDEQEIAEPSKAKFNFVEFLKYSGPGWLAVVAYIDPGNMYADITAGSAFAYSQLWVIFWASILSWLALALCCSYGIYCRQHLAKAFREGYPKWVNWLMWLWVEIVVIATDIPEVIGFAYACNIFFGWALWIGVLASFGTTMLFLAVLAFGKGYRILELLVSLLVGMMCVLLVVELFMSGANVKQLFFGWAVPQIWTGAIFNMIGIFGAVVMPHNLFLLTGVVQTRIPRGRAQTRKIVMYSWIEPILPLCVSWVCNLAIVSLAAQNVFPLTCPSGETEDPTGVCAAGPVINDPTLDPDTVTLLNFCEYFSVGRSGCILWGLALLAAAQASAMTTTFTGSFVMDGFVNLHIPLWARSIGTRIVAITPAVAIAAAVNDPVGLNNVIGVVNVILGLALPMCLVPLLKLARKSEKMGKYRIGKWPYWLALAFNIFLVFFNTLTFFAPFEDFKQKTAVKQAFSAVGAIIYIAACGYFVIKEPQVSEQAPLADPGYRTENDTEEIDLGAVGMKI